MSGDHQRIEVYESRLFKRVMDSLDEKTLTRVEDEIEKIIENPEIGIRKKADLKFLWVHKFKIDGREMLLGYHWNEGRLELYLLNIGPHENFYRDAKKRRKSDLKLLR
ncbi:type II toxin-antitoxin system RelE/ParE family toxin [Neptuniibacter halophilus]|uniref:type II toxin-antitoxin system RelE/ParE family toxin n=1 Tax=Neptuniibacter halophilus TaxID=651666 RepID=UPI0025722542|nr:type II toxin-antitoxin system RelE/ParE family toxin [Neptuniibacter halophilus]